MILNLTDDRRPIFSVGYNNVEFSTLLDTGALFSVYTKDENTLLQLVPDARLINEEVLISGFGGNGGRCKVYLLPYIDIGEISIINLPVAVQENNKIKTELILSSRVLYRNKFEIDYSSKTISIDSNIKSIRCGIHRYVNNSKIIDYFYVFSQKDNQ